MPSTQTTSVGYLGALRDQPKLIPILITVMLVMSGMGVISPVLSIYAASFGVSITMVGLFITAFGIGRLLVNIPTGILAERLGRKRLILAGTLTLCVSSIGAALADSFYGLVFWRFVQGLGSGCYMTVVMASCADLSTPKNRGRVMALYQTAILLGAGMGPAIGGFVAELYGFRAPFWAFAAVAALAAIFAVFQFTETLDQGPGDTNGSASNAAPSSLSLLSSLLHHRGFLAVTIITFGIFFTRTAAQWQLIPLIGDGRFGLSLAVIGIAMTLQAGANLAMLPAAGILIDRFGHNRSILVAVLSLAISLLMIALAPAVWVYFVGVILVGISVGVAGPASTAFAADQAPDGRFGPAMGVLRTFGDAGFVLGPILAGLTADLLVFGYAGGMALNALIIVVGAAIFALATRDDRIAQTDDSPATVDAAQHKSDL